jgi:drug/metabolite transporter (DMT)-like permease
MAVLLALASAASYGVGDFFGGTATRRAPAAAVLLWSHVVGLCLLLAGALVIHGDPTAADLAIGAAAGLAGALGIGLLYHALSLGQMGEIAPVTGLLAAAVPVAAGYAQGERPALTAVVGMALALAAIVLVSAEGGGSLRPSDWHGVRLALGAGLAFGSFFVIISHTGDGSGVWPMVAARAASVVVVGALALAGRVPAAIPRGGPQRATAAAGTLDMTANVLYLLAVREGLLSVVSVLSSLYPASTVVLAWVILRERFAPLQRVGLLLAVPAAVLLSL